MEVISITVHPEGTNQPPVFDPIGDKTIYETQLLEFNVTASDTDGPAPMVLEGWGFPNGAAFQDNGNGTGKFTWLSVIGDATVNPLNLTFTATDGLGLTSAETLLINVLPIEFLPQAFRQDLSNQGIVSIEAEHFQAKIPYGSHNWIPSALGGSSGNEAMKAAPDISVSITENYAPQNSSRLDFDVNFVRTGTHYVWVRGYGPNLGGDSIHIGLDYTAVPSAGTMKSFSPNKSWVWCGDAEGTGILAPATINIPSTGLHTVNAWMREDGFIIDKIVLTTDPNYVPTNLGPPESSYGYGQ